MIYESKTKYSIILLIIFFFSGCINAIDFKNSDGGEQERINMTNPNDLDTDHDGIRDYKDSNPLFPGIFTNSQEKVKEYDYLYYNLSFGKSFGDPKILNSRKIRHYVLIFG